MRNDTNDAVRHKSIKSSCICLDALCPLMTAVRKIKFSSVETVHLYFILLFSLPLLPLSWGHVWRQMPTPKLSSRGKGMAAPW